MFPPNFICAERIGSGIELSSKKRVLQQLGELLASSTPGLNPEEVFDHLLERERLGSTGLGHGIALPHARMPHLERSVGALVQLKSGVDFDAIDDKPVDLAFALLVPQDATEAHLQLLAKLASMFSDVQFCERLRDAADPVALMALIQEWESSVGST